MFHNIITQQEYFYTPIYMMLLGNMGIIKYLPSATLYSFSRQNCTKTSLTFWLTFYVTYRTILIFNTKWAVCQIFVLQPIFINVHRAFSVLIYF